MKKNILLTGTMIVIFLLIVIGNVFAESNITKAENFMKAERWSQAVKVLENEISENSDNAEAYFMLGTIYFSQKNYPRADKEFASAIAFKSSYQSDVGKKYQAAGLDSLNRGNVLEAVELFTRTIKHQPGLSKNIADICFQAGKRYFSIFRDDLADKLFSLAKSDTSLVKQIKVEETKYGEKILEIAKKELSEGKRQIAIKYLGQEHVDTEFPSRQWVMILEKALVGQGTEGDTAVRVAKFGDEIKFGDKIVIIAKNGENFFVTDAGEWQKHKGVYEVANQIRNGSGYLYISAEKGVEFHFELQRFMYPSEKDKLANFSLNQ